MKKTNFILLFIFISFSSVVLAKNEENTKSPKGSKQKILVHEWDQALKEGKSRKRYFPEVASPIVLGNTIFAGTHSSIFYALNLAEKGKSLWQFVSSGPIASQPVTDGTHIYFGNNKGHVYSLDMATGKKNWEFYTGAEILAAPNLKDKLLILVTTSREVYALDTSTGRSLWSAFIKGFERKFTMRGNASIVIAGGKLLIGFADGQVVGLSPNNGSILWSRNLSEGTNAQFLDTDAALLVDGASLYVTGYYGNLTRLDLSSGRTIWTKDLTCGVDLSMDGATIYASSMDGKVIAFDKKNGVRRWEVSLHSGTLSAPLLFEKGILVGSENNRAFVLDSKTGRVLQVVPVAGGFLSNAILSHSSIYLLGSNAKLHAFKF